MTVLRSFEDFPQEGALVGRMVVGYTDLEIDLMNCVKAVRDDLDTVFKAMYRVRSEHQRLEVADALGRQAYREINLGTEFQMALGAVRHCLKIRNQYAHSAWWNDHTGKLAFANLEELAKLNDIVTSLHGLKICHVTVPLLEQQFAYFERASNLLIWTLQEGNRVLGRPVHPGIQKPSGNNEEPPLFES
ncbi:MAG: hypothetical protein HC782_03590 [Gammaproteobacteria bacterium]|nr:hypothetical protein [Gammaproteobacteria bacterium]